MWLPWLDPLAVLYKGLLWYILAVLAVGAAALLVAVLLLLGKDEE